MRGACKAHHEHDRKRDDVGRSKGAAWHPRHYEVRVDGRKHFIDMRKATCVVDDDRGHHEDPDDEDDRLDQGRPRYCIQSANRGIDHGYQGRDEERKPQGDRKEPHQHNCDGGVLPDKVDERNDDPCDSRERAQRRGAFVPVGEVVLHGHVPGGLCHIMEFDTKEDDTEPNRERDEDLFPHGRPAVRYPSPETPKSDMPEQTVPIIRRINTQNPSERPATR